MGEHLQITLSIVFFVYLVIWFTYVSLNTIPRPRLKSKSICLLKNIQWKTGDIILFHSNPFINLFTNSIWSHVGIVLVGNSGKARIFEITAHSHYVSLNPLIDEITDELSNGNNVIAYRRISPAPDAKKLKSFAIQSIKDKVHYDHVYWREFHKRIFGSLFPIKTTQSDATVDKTTLCSGLIASALQYSGVLNKDRNSLEFLPTDFGEMQVSNTLPPYEFGPLTFVKMEK